MSIDRSGHLFKFSYMPQLIKEVRDVPDGEMVFGSQGEMTRLEAFAWAAMSGMVVPESR